MSNSKSGRGSLLAEGSQRLWHLRVVWVPSYYLHSVYPGPDWEPHSTEPYRPIFIAIALIAIFFAWRRIYRRADDCNPDNTCATPNARKSYKVMFWLVAVLTLTALAYPYVVPLFY